MDPYPHSVHCPWSCPCQYGQIENGNYFPCLDAGAGAPHTHPVPTQQGQPLLTTSFSAPVPTTSAPSVGPVLPPLDLPEKLYPNNPTLKAQLRTVLSSHWYQYKGGDPEPQHDLRPFIEELSTEEFRCSACSKVLQRLDRAEDHFRVHIEHRPYPCVGDCGNPDCDYRSYTKTTLKAHELRQTKQGTCRNCRKQLASKNIKRHQGSKSCKLNSSSKEMTKTILNPY